MKLEADGTALLIIDMQTALVAGAYREPEVLGALASLIARSRAARVPVVFVQHNHASFRPLMKGQSGWQIHPDLAPQTGDLIIEKTASDAFYRTPLEKDLRRHGVKRLLLTGMQTEYCIDTTARAALSLGFDVVLPGDCHTTGDAALTAADIIRHHNLTLTNLAHPDVSITLVESAAVEFVSRPEIR